MSIHNCVCRAMLLEVQLFVGQRLKIAILAEPNQKWQFKYNHKLFYYFLNVTCLYLQLMYLITTITQTVIIT